MTIPDSTGEEIEEELQLIKAENSAGNDEQMTVMQVVRRPGLRFPLLIYVLVHLSIPFSGLTGIFFYSTSYFRRSGLSCEDSQYTTIGIGLLVILTSVVMLPLMDRIGRRTLYLTCLTGALLTLCLATATMIYAGDVEPAECGKVWSPLSFTVSR